MKYECTECGTTSEHTVDGEMIHLGRRVEILATCGQCRYTNEIRVSVHPPPADEERYREHDWLNEQYTNKGRTMSDIGEGCGVSAMTIYQWLKKHGIETRRRGQRS
jgi:hypothetical protein